MTFFAVITSKTGLKLYSTQEQLHYSNSQSFILSMQFLTQKLGFMKFPTISCPINLWVDCSLQRSFRLTKINQREIL